MTEPKKIFVGLSGGVDSAVSAAILRRAGHTVTGVFIKIWQPEFTECTWREDRLDAMRVAAHLKIPFREIDLSDEYKQEVVQDMIAAYQRGVTPNPDVLCNEKIKFGHFLRYALENGADMVATGHYAISGTHEGSDMHELLRGADPDKDQSYFLYRLGQHELSHAMFPVGVHTKRKVREMAASFGLPVATKHDSQGLCFVGAVSIPDFLSKYIELSRGPVIDARGEVVGEHDGAALFTVGQRHGFRIHTSVSKPLYVQSVDTTRNTVVVSEDPARAAVSSVELSHIHWIRESKIGTTMFVQTRYRETPVEAKLEGTTLHFLEPHVVSPGQSIVFFQGPHGFDECYGGGIALGIHTST